MPILPEHYQQEWDEIVQKWYTKDSNHATLRVKICRNLIQHKKLITFEDNEEICRYTQGYYRPHADKMIKTECKRNIATMGKTHVNEILDYIKAMTYVDRTLLDDFKDFVCLENTNVNTRSCSLVKHSPDIIQLSKLNIEHDFTADCPKVKKFMGEVLKPEDVPKVQELFGYCLTKEYPIQKAFLMIGAGRNGKSTVLNLLRKFLGDKNVCSVSLHDISANRFAGARLYSKLANIYPDLSGKALTDTGLFKIATGSDSMGAEQKYRDGFDFYNYAKLVFSCNDVPDSYDDSDAYYRRWELILFPHKFEGKEDKKNLLAELTTPEEMSGLLNWALEGLKRLRTQGEFTNTVPTDELREMYQKMANSVASFAMEILEHDSYGWIEKDILYDIYMRYCKKNEIPAKYKAVFLKDLPRFIEVREERRTIEGRRVHGISGVNISSEKIEEHLSEPPKPDNGDKELVFEKYDVADFGKQYESVRLLVEYGNGEKGILDMKDSPRLVVRYRPVIEYMKAEGVLVERPKNVFRVTTSED